MKMHDLEYQCDFCLSILPTQIWRNPTPGGNFYFVEAFKAMSTLSDKDLIVCPKCLREKFGFQLINEQFEKVKVIMPPEDK